MKLPRLLADTVRRLGETAPVRRLRAWRARLRAWRRIRFTLAGGVFTLGAFAVGFAAINTGNNLLYLLLGAMLGFVAVSGWLSEQTIRALDFDRHTPRGTPVGREVRIDYVVRNRKSRLPTMALELYEEGLRGGAFAGRIPAGGTVTCRSRNRFVRRGVYPLESLTLSTTFPFGLFRKEREVALPGEIVIWPRSDRPVRPPRPGGGRSHRLGPAAAAAAGHRGEYRSLREYRPGDDPSDIHWRRSAGRTMPVVREYETEGSDAFWLCLDTGGRPGPKAEGLVEVAASVAARAAAEGRSFGLVAGDRALEPGTGPGHLEAVLDLLARTDFSPGDPPPEPPVEPARCVLVSLTGRGRERFGDWYEAGEPASPPEAATTERETVTLRPRRAG